MADTQTIADTPTEQFGEQSGPQSSSMMGVINDYITLTKPLIAYYMKWRESGDLRAPLYVNIYGKGSVEHIRDKLFAALAAKPR